MVALPSKPGREHEPWLNNKGELRNIPDAEWESYSTDTRWDYFRVMAAVKEAMKAAEWRERTAAEAWRYLP